MSSLYSLASPALDAENKLLHEQMLIIEGYPFAVRHYVPRQLSMPNMPGAAE